MKTAAYFLRPFALIAVVLVSVSSAQSSSTSSQNMAGPFGFHCGMSRQAITGLVGPLKDEGVNEYSTSAAPKPFPNIGYNLLTVSPTQGLVKVSAVTNDIYTDSDGADLIRQFHTIEADLIQQYGKPTRQEDLLKPGSIWAGQDEWTISYMKKERTLASAWVFPNSTACVASIELTVEVAAPYAGVVQISFGLQGYSPPATSQTQKKNTALESSQ